jgi:hypothetical protein
MYAETIISYACVKIENKIFPVCAAADAVSPVGSRSVCVCLCVCVYVFVCMCVTFCVLQTSSIVTLHMCFKSPL